MSIQSNFSKRVHGSFSWIPNEILNNEQLSFKAKGLWVYLNGKPEFWNFSADNIAKETKDGPKAIRAALKELAEASLLKAMKQTDGHIHYILFDKPNCQNGNEPDCQNVNLTKSQFDKRATYNKTLSSNKTLNSNKTLVLDKSNSEDTDLVETYGNEKINEVFERYKQIFGYEVKPTKGNRFAVYNFLRAKDKGPEWLEKLMQIWYYSRSDRFSPRISDFAELQKKYPALLEWAQRQGINKKQQNNLNEL